jgi:death-on-curing protein
MTTQHLTLGDIVDIRDRFAAADPWRFEIVNPPGLLTALTTPFQAAFGAEAFPGLVDKAAALVFLLIANHPFRDGNKRIAGEALRLFLGRNGLALRASPDDMRALTRLVTTIHEPRDERLVGWIEERSTPDSSLPYSTPSL